MSNFDILKNILDAQQDTSTKAYDTTADHKRQGRRHCAAPCRWRVCLACGQCHCAAYG